MTQALRTGLARSFGRKGLAALGRARRLKAQEWGQLLVALPAVVSVRLQLWRTTSRHVHERILRRPPGGKDLPATTTVESLGNAVARASRLVPHATCLTQALALQHLLRRCGLRSRVEIGFLRGDEGDVKGHAWLVFEGRVVIGGTGAANFTRTMSLEG